MPSKVQARANRKHLPSMGLPLRHAGELDPIVRYREGRWEGADSIKATPRWTMWAMKADAKLPLNQLAPILEFCRKWAEEKPRSAAEVVYGPYRGGWFVSVCKKTRTSLGWRSIAFVIPPEGMLRGKSIYFYSKSVNWLESHIGYNLYPKLPSHLQEIIEEMSATELLCPFQEFDPGLDEHPEQEIDYDWEEDYRDM